MVDFINIAGIIWLSLSIVLLATCWYFGLTLSTLFPIWWKDNVVDYDPYYQQLAQNYHQNESEGQPVILSQPPVDHMP